jgi:N-acetylmuramoyl-L-alanine amidase
VEDVTEARRPWAIPLLFGLVLWTGPSDAAGLESALQVLINGYEFMPGLVLRKLEIKESRATLGFEIPENIDLSDLPPEFENLYEIAVGMIAAQRPDIQRIDLLVAHPNQTLRPPPVINAIIPTRTKDERVTNTLIPLDRYPHGQSLRGRTIAISPGHGWIYNSNTQDYRTQRGRIRWTDCGDCRGIIEDFETHEIVTDHLIPLLEGAGARVVLVRERSHDKQVKLVDDRDPTYREVSGTFRDGTSAGGNNDNYRVSGDANAQVEWTLTAPSDGEHFLSLWFVAGGNRYQDAVLEVQSPKNTHHFVLDQTVYGRRWTPIQSFGLLASENLTVRLRAPSSANAFLIADAARLGAGLHSTAHPWWEMGAKPFAAHQNAPTNIQSIGDVSIRPIYAEWYDADIYLSVHSNASGQPNSTAAGTSSYRYNCGQFNDHSSDPPASQCDDPVGSDRLQELVHNSMITALKTRWDSNWVDRGTKVANFGELRNLDDMPGVLLETAFHDNVRQSQNSALKMTDNQALHDPRFRDALAYGIYRGISNYFDETAPLLAAPPQAIVAKRINADTVELSFESVSDALSYRIYTACGHPDFNEGQIVSSSPARISQLATADSCYFKITALNAAGESLESKIVSARPSRRPAQLLIVDAYERQDAWVERIDNRHNTLMVHGQALQAEAVAFDGATEAALRQGMVNMSDYDGIIFALGRESVEHEILTPMLRQQISTYPGAIFASGSEIAWTLDERGDAESKEFLRSRFGATFGGDDAGVRNIQAATNEWLQGVSNIFTLEDGSSNAIEARSSDVLLPQNGAAVVLTYAGPNTVAGIRSERNMLLGFALDSVSSSETRAQILSAWVNRAITLSPEEMSEDGGVTTGIDGGTKPSGSMDAGIVTNTMDAHSQESSRRPLSFRALAENPIRGGCRCDAHNASQRVPSSAIGLTLVFLIIYFRRRERL